MVSFYFSRRSLRLTSIESKSESCGVKEDLPKINDVILPMGHKTVLEGKDDGRRYYIFIS